MPSERQAAAAESWRKMLAGIEPLLGRLAWLASLRNQNKGTYEHFGLAERIGEDAADNLIRRSHLEIFQEWLCFGLERQKEEIEAYFASLDGDRDKILANWLTLTPYASWIPAETRDVERTLFSVDLETVLELIRSESGVASRDPDL